MTITPDVGLKAIDVIIKLIPFLKTWTGQRRREYFEQLIVPLYTAFEEVHDFYVELILQTRDAIVDVGTRSEDFSGRPRDPLETKRQMTAALETYARRRRVDEHVRDTLRQDAQVFLSRIKWQDERHFLVLICFYFLQRGGISWSGQILDREISEVIERSGVTYWDTPAMRLYEALREAQSSDDAIAILDDARNDLNQSYMNVRLAFRRVQNTLVLET